MAALAGAPWYVQQATGALRQSAKSPGSGWILIAGSAGMTQQQAEQALIQMVLHDNQGMNIAPGIDKAASAAANAIPGLTQIGDFFGALSSKNLWIRVAKVIIGGTLIIVGLSHMTGADNAVANAARKVKILPV